MEKRELVTAARAVIFSNGSYANLTGIARRLRADDYIVCADGALKHLVRLQIWPDLLVGDFDSIDGELLAAAKEQGVEMLTFEREKDYTDTELAWQAIREQGYRQLLVVGGWGDRLDHSLANLLLFAPYGQTGYHICMTDGTTDAYLVSDKLSLRHCQDRLVSIIALTPVARGVTARGLYWPLNDATLNWGQALGISNIPVAEEVTIEVQEGLLLVVVTPED
ncbi:MAG: thiamine diphosphokinase [Firmicutes bacterium]|nr:thiamine diphosphokinase [Bacillota bacterium]